MPARFADVERYALELPEVTVGARWDHKTWSVGKKGFAWERPLNKADVKRWGDATPLPQGDIVAVRVEDLDEKAAVLEARGSPRVAPLARLSSRPGGGANSPDVEAGRHAQPSRTASRL